MAEFTEFRLLLEPTEYPEFLISLACWRSLHQLSALTQRTVVH